MKLGLGDYSILFAMTGCIVATVVCVIYGVLNWNGKKESNVNASSTDKKERDEK
jgi:hypothetical protein